MYIWAYLRGYVTDWVSGMSGAASVVLTFWATFMVPDSQNLRNGLWMASAVCFLVSSYRVWVKEHLDVKRLQDTSNAAFSEIALEFNEIRANMLLNSLENVISTELARLKSFLHKNSYLLNDERIRMFYDRFIRPKEIHLTFGAALDLKQADYEVMMQELQQMDIRSAIEGISSKAR
jgi:hypothetical protein